MIAIIRIGLMDVDIRAALALAAQWNIYAYDGYFLQCPIQARCPLLAMDRRMRRAAEEMNIKSSELI